MPGESLMAKPAFGPAATYTSFSLPDCVVADCAEPAVMASQVLPVCEKHLIVGYREMSQYLTTRQQMGEVEPEPYKSPTPAKPKSRLPGVLGIPTIEPGWYVYYMRFGDRVKIGVTSNLPVRLEGIPNDELLTAELGSYELEKQRHREFAQHRVNGEWFRLGPELKQHIQSVIDREDRLGPGMRRFVLRQRLLRRKIEE